ncbi:hypothetical protein GGS26DRAFT_535639 [Hypomontagnella submonticulosa]|nr:hypothetical protein GGS26DRAFT_535639 [Hypomontagnella submonticulosa]
MKSNSLLRSLTLLNALAAANPVAYAELERYTVDWEPTKTSSALEARDTPDWCHGVNAAVAVFKELPPDWKSDIVSVSALTGATGVFGYYLCKLVHPTGDPPCEDVAKPIAAGVAFIMLAVREYKKMGRQGTRVAPREDFVMFLEGHLRSRNIEFESIDLMPLAARGIDDDASAASVRILGVRDESGMAADHELSMGSNDTGTHTVSYLSRSEDGALDRRAGGPQFKISYDYFKMGTGSIDHDAVHNTGFNIAKDWEKNMDKHHDWGHYIVKADMGPADSIALHIIPESGNFNQDFESPHVCKKIS